MALVSSSITIPTEVTDSEWTLSNKMTLISLHPPGIQCSSPVTPIEPKQMDGQTNGGNSGRDSTSFQCSKSNMT
ncbi:hypothetical protein CY35_01G018400 [Sphagnum magellanicum]|nr:hypothetical protein CY35_01G018400 [Sphagnum magellanicum]